MKYLALAAYVACVIAANWLTERFGLVHVAGLVVTAGTFAAGLSFVARDAVQEAAGRFAVVGAILLGAGLSGLLSPLSLAVASGVTFVVSETADMVVYTPLRRRTRIGSWVTSNVVGSLVDSALFLWLAGFPLSGFFGQSAVKVAVGVATPLALVATVGGSRAVLRHRLNRAGA